MHTHIVLVHSTDGHPERSYKLEKFYSFFSSKLHLDTYFCAFNNRSQGRFWFLFSPFSQIVCFFRILSIKPPSFRSSCFNKPPIFLLVPGTPLLNLLLSFFGYKTYLYHAGPSRLAFKRFQFSLRTLVDRLNYFLVSFIVVPSEQCKIHFNLDYLGPKVKIGYFPLNPSFISAASLLSKPLKSTSDSSISLCYVGNFGFGDHAIRRLDWLLNAIHDLVQDGIRLKLQVLGSKSSIPHQYEPLFDFDYITIINWANSHDVALHINNSDFLILPTISEGLATVLMEAAYLSTPVIASRVGGNIDLIGDDELRGYFLSPPDSFKADLLAAISSPHSLTLSKVTKMKIFIDNYLSDEQLIRTWNNVFV